MASNVNAPGTPHTFVLDSYVPTRPRRGGGTVVRGERLGLRAANTTIDFNLSSLSWQDDAACQGLDTDEFFPSPGADVTEVVAICRNCPVWQQCRQYALDNPTFVGIWGGLTDKQRNSIRGKERSEKYRSVGASA